jgi:RNA polymerase sigma-70 factor, ECF subfamily
MTLSLEEQSLISSAAAGDPDAFAKLYVLYQPAVFRRVYSLVENRQEADDITSEAFLRAWNAISRFEDRGVSILAWLSTIAQRIALKQLGKRRPSVPIEDLPIEADEYNSPERVAERNADVDVLRRAVVNLPEVQRQVISKRFLEHLSYDEVGTALGKPVGTVRVIQHRALRTLRVFMQKDGQLRPRARGATGGPE